MKTLVILHGWQSSKEKWQGVKENLEKEGIRVIVPDIPGFKPETALQKTWNLDDYLCWFKDFLAKEKGLWPDIAEGFFLLGHSFGARISLKFAKSNPEELKGLILVSAAGLKKRPTFFEKIFQWLVKMAKVLKIEELPFFSQGVAEFLKKIFYRFILRKTDYFRASGFLKETIKNILNEDLTLLLGEISSPTLILWGEKDRITPPEDAFLIKEKTKNSKLEILKGVGHAPHLEKPQVLAQKIKEFLTR